MTCPVIPQILSERFKVETGETSFSICLLNLVKKNKKRLLNFEFSYTTKVGITEANCLVIEGFDYYVCTKSCLVRK